MGDVVGKIIGVILSAILCIIAPLVIVVMSDDMSDRRILFAEITSLVDEIVDTGEITNEQLVDFYTAVSSHGPICEVRIVRKMRAANMNTEGKVEITYMPIDVTVGALGKDVLETFNTGDLVNVRVAAVDYSGMQKAGRAFLGGFLKPIDLQIEARVR